MYRKVPKPSSIGGNVGTLQDFEETELYKGVYAYVEDYMSRYDMSHDFNHILRVLSFAKRILESESEDGSKKFDDEDDDEEDDDDDDDEDDGDDEEDDEDDA